MDNLLLEAAIHEIRREAVGLPLHRFVPEGPARLTLLLGAGWGVAGSAEVCRRLFVSVDPGLPILHLARGRTPSPSTPTPFQGLLARELEGSRLVAVEKERWERWGAFSFEVAGAGGARLRRLAFELLGARCNLLLLGEDGTILGHLHEAAGFRALGVGARYVPPASGDRTPPDTLAEPEWCALLAPGPAGLARRLGKHLRGMSPALLAEVEREAVAGQDPWDRFRGWAARAAAGDLDLRVYVPAAGGPDPTPRVLLTPFPVSPPAGWREEQFASAGEALQAFREAHEADLALTSVRASLEREIAREIARLERLEAGLARDLAREGEAEELQRQGTILLAGLNQARVAGDQAVLPDPFDAAGGEQTLTIDPRLSLQENAARLFHRARKSRRGRDTVQRRLAEAQERLPRLRAAAAEVASHSTRADLEAAEARLGRAGLLRIVRRARPKKAAPTLAAAPILPVRAYASADGMEILIGKGGRENDLLTFKIAAPHDFWMHASGHAGAHVVVRNPQKLKQLPQATLLQAARLAAFHSKARGAGQVEVIVTQRRQVKKGKNLPPGMVRVQRHTSVQVPPTHPFDEEV